MKPIMPKLVEDKLTRKMMNFIGVMSTGRSRSFLLRGLKFIPDLPEQSGHPASDEPEPVYLVELDSTETTLARNSPRWVREGFRPTTLCVCVCERERARESERERACVCVRERERERRELVACVQVY